MLGKTYYWHSKTREARWSLPLGISADLPVSAGAVGAATAKNESIPIKMSVDGDEGAASVLSDTSTAQREKQSGDRDERRSEETEPSGGSCISVVGKTRVESPETVVICARCSVSVHRGCYGISGRIDPARWLCRPCAAEYAPSPLSPMWVQYVSYASL